MGVAVGDIFYTSPQMWGSERRKGVGGEDDWRRVCLRASGASEGMTAG